jgi:hypothetical protein
MIGFSLAVAAHYCILNATLIRTQRTIKLKICASGERRQICIFSANLAHLLLVVARELHGVHAAVARPGGFSIPCTEQDVGREPTLFCRQKRSVSENPLASDVPCISACITT